jgi:O-antigen/teichoic acid export membrane protein
VDSQIFNKSTFLKNLKTYAGGGVVAKFLSVLVFMFIVKILTVEEFSQLAIYLIVVDLLTVIASFGLASTMLRIEFLDKKTILINSIVLLISSSFILSLFFLIFFPSLIDIMGGNYTFLIQYKFIIILAFIVKSFMALFRGFLVSVEEPKIYIKLMIFMELLFFIAIIISTLIHFRTENNGLIFVVMSQTLSIFLATIYGFFLIYKTFPAGNISINVIKTIISKSWAYMLKNLIGVMQMEASKIILSIVATSTILGVYSFYSLVVNKMSFFVGMFDKVYVPKIKNLYTSQDTNKIKHADLLVKKVTMIYACLSLLAMLSIALIFIFISNNKSLFTFLNQEYLDYLDLFFLIILSWVIGNFRSFFDVWQYMDKKTLNIRLLGSHFVILLLLYFGGLWFYSYFDMFGLIYNQLLITICYLIFSVYQYKKYCMSEGSDQ